MTAGDPEQTVDTPQRLRLLSRSNSRSSTQIQRLIFDRSRRSQIGAPNCSCCDMIEELLLVNTASSLLIALPNVLFEGTNGLLRITDDVRHGLSRLFQI